MFEDIKISIYYVYNVATSLSCIKTTMHVYQRDRRAFTLDSGLTAVL